jgi:hypothetical protein
MDLRMSHEEKNLFRLQLDSASNYLEFGMGGSTIAAIERGLPVVSVESDRQWISNVQETIGQQFPERKSNFKPIFVDIGPTREWGIPCSKEKQHLWPNYFMSVWADLDKTPDFVLIDGRFRTACFFSCLFALPSTTRIAIHDFRDGYEVRKNYEKSLEFADIEAAAGTLVVLRKKPEFDHLKAVAAFHSVMNDYW